MNAPVNILLVDDESRNLDALESVLALPDLRLVRARTPDEALLALMRYEFACIVLDIQMPTMTGIELAKLIKTRKRTQHIPIIFLTAYFLEEKDVLQGYGAGAVDYLTKPISPQVLKSKVGVFVDLFRTTSALAEANNALEMEILQRKTAEEALRQMNTELETRVNDRTAELKRAHDDLLAASRAKDEFLAVLSHELRTPLNPVLLLASEMAVNQSLPAEIRADFNTIRKNVELEARLIDDLLDLTRITRGKVILEKQFLDAHKVLRDAIANVQADAEHKNIFLKVKLNAPEYAVLGDAVRLQQIFWNLLKNAIKFTASGGVSVETANMNGKLAIKISDTGIGMNTTEVANVFNAFAQTGNQHRFGGLGLGLAISQKLVEFHFGEIRAESEGPDKGSTFTVELPVVAAKINGHDVPELSSSAPKTDDKQNSAIRILLVEDHEPTRSTLVYLLSRRKYAVTAAATLAEARKLAENQRFELVISDIGLPDGTGYDLMIELRKRSAVCGIALTGYGMEEDLARSQAAGFVVHLTKPVRIQSLENALADAKKMMKIELAATT
ncbi:MAG TPA: response regulator [Verrucomicrobiae bacterium]|nr:response regulator [Verrucomicrobiae bacterium]